MNPLQQLAGFGQAVWLDYIRRDLMTSGRLQHLIDADGVRGLTSNPAIFQKAMADEAVYDEDIHRLKREGKSAREIFEAVSVQDVQMAADVFRPLYDQTGGQHGYVSLEVNPHLARDTQGTVEEARRLWAEMSRPNVFIKVPGTAEGLPAITQLISEGINVNVTLLFGLPRYAEVADAYLKGIEDRLELAQPVDRVRSVASFFLSRIDVLLDPRLEEFIRAGGEQGELAKPLRGEVAIASAKAAYEIYLQMIASDRWRAAAARGAVPQWLLWASTSTKNPDYSDVKYVEPLVGPDTINTMPMETIEAYRDHGKPRTRIREGLEQARFVLGRLPQLGLDIDEATQRLENEGLEKFCKPFDALLETLERETAAA